jgi:hypothetical protein
MSGFAGKLNNFSKCDHTHSIRRSGMGISKTLQAEFRYTISSEWSENTDPGPRIRVIKVRKWRQGRYCAELISELKPDLCLVRNKSGC